MLNFWPGPGVNLLAGAGVFPRQLSQILPGPGRAGGRDFGRGPGRPLISISISVPGLIFIIQSARGADGSLSERAGDYERKNKNLS